MVYQRVYLDDVEALTVWRQQPDALERGPRGQAARLRGACARRKRRVDDVDVEGPEDVVSSPEPGQDQAHRPVDPEPGELRGGQLGQARLLDESARGREVEVAHADLDRVADAHARQLQRSTHPAGLAVATLGAAFVQQVKMSIEVQDADRPPVGVVEAPERA